MIQDKIAKTWYRYGICPYQYGFWIVLVWDRAVLNFTVHLCIVSSSIRSVKESSSGSADNRIH